MMDYSETIEVNDRTVGKNGTLNESMEMYMYQRSRSFFDPCPRSLRMKVNLR